MAYTRDQLAQLVAEYATSFGIDRAIALAQLRRESASFRADVVYGPFVGSAGERGLAQFTPATWANWGAGDPYDPDASLNAWGSYMTWLLVRYGGNYTKALQGYNGGPGNVDRGTVSAAAQRYAREVLAAAGQPIGSGASDLPESSYPIITSNDGEETASNSNPPSSTNSSFAPLLIGGLALLAIVVITSD